MGGTLVCHDLVQKHPPCNWPSSLVRGRNDCCDEEGVSDVGFKTSVAAHAGHTASAAHTAATAATAAAHTAAATAAPTVEHSCGKPGTASSAAMMVPAARTVSRQVQALQRHAAALPVPATVGRHAGQSAAAMASTADFAVAATTGPCVGAAAEVGTQEIHLPMSDCGPSVHSAAGPTRSISLARAAATGLAGGLQYCTQRQPKWVVWQ